MPEAIAVAAPSAGETERAQSVPRKRVTFTVPEALDQALEVYCSGTGQMKNEVAAAAIAAYLTQNRQRLQEALDATTSALSRLIPNPPTGRHRHA